MNCHCKNIHFIELKYLTDLSVFVNSHKQTKEMQDAIQLTIINRIIPSDLSCECTELNVIKITENA